LDNFIKSQKEKYGYGKVGKTLLQQKASESNVWLKNISTQPPPHDEWLIYLILKNNSLGLQKIVDEFKIGTTPRDEISEILQNMVNAGKLEKTEGHQGFYSLSDNTRSKYFTFDSKEIGTAKDIPYVAEKTVSYYLKKKFFLTMANQIVRKGKLMTDLVAFDYEQEIPISVEIESSIEKSSHREHVKLNMLKWKDLGFKECHVWSTNPTIQTTYDSLTNEQKEHVEIHILEKEE